MQTEIETKSEPETKPGPNTIQRCRWCQDLGSYEVFEDHSREFPVTKLEWKLHSQYLYEGLIYGYADKLTLEDKKIQQQKNIVRRGQKIPGLIVSYDALIRKYPNGDHRDKYVRSFAEHCHICSIRFQKDHDQLIKKINSCTDAKDLSGADLYRVDLARLWGK